MLVTLTRLSHIINYIRCSVDGSAIRTKVMDRLLNPECIKY